jgi:hypothetical protein
MDIEFLYEAVEAERHARARASEREARARRATQPAGIANRPPRLLARIAALRPGLRFGAARTELRRSSDT